MDLFYLGYLRKSIADYISSKVNSPAEQIILIMTIASAIPFSWAHYFFRNKTQRLIYSLVVGFILQYSIYGIKIWHTIFSTITSYLFVYFYGRKLSPFYLLIGTMIHLSYLNISKMIDSYGDWMIDDISTIYMVELAKFLAFAFSYDDGKKEAKDIRSEHHRKYRIEKMPSFLEYSAYIYFYPTAIIGPFINYMDFINFIEEKDCYKDLKNKLGYIFKQGLYKLLLCELLFSSSL